MRSTLLKIKSVFAPLIATVIILDGCAADTNNGKPEAIDLISNEFPEAQREIEEVLNGIVESVKKGDVDRLISYHAYGPKFTEFKDGKVRNNDKENESHERNVFGAVTNVINFDFNDTKRPPAKAGGFLKRLLKQPFSSAPPAHI